MAVGTRSRRLAPMKKPCWTVTGPSAAIQAEAETLVKNRPDGRLSI
jgi:hypothetical protein